MKTGIIIILCVGSLRSFCQTVIDKMIPVSPSQKIVMHFDYPPLIRITTWDKNQISIHGTVNINNGENDDAFELTNTTAGEIVTIRNEIKNMQSIPKRITVTDGASKIVFRDNEELKKYQRDHGKIFNTRTCGVDMDIVLEIKVPRNVETHIESVYGMVEIKDFSGPLTAEATYGGIDAALIETATGELSAETNFGEVFTNFTTKFSGQKNDQHDFHTYVSAKPGNGPHYSFIAKYGNVYIRKSE